MHLRPILPALLTAALGCAGESSPPPLRVETITSNLLVVDSIPTTALVEHEGGEVAQWIMDSRRTGEDRAMLALADGRRLRLTVDTTTAPTPLTIAVSTGDSAWAPAVVLELHARPDARPALMRAPDGTIHVTYALDAHRFRHLALRLR